MENEKRLIDANALSCEINCCSFETGYDGEKVLEIIAEAPTVDAVEVVHGRWVNYCNDLMWHECSACGYRIQYFYSKDCKYCPNCGAKMDGGDNHE